MTYSLEPKGTPARPHHQENKALLRDHAGYLRMPYLLGAAILGKFPLDFHDLFKFYHLFQSQTMCETALGWDKQLLLCK